MNIAYTTHLIRYAMDEKNDCTVRALATASGMPYDKAHAILRDHGRRMRTGVRITPLANAYRAAIGAVFQPISSTTLDQFTQDHSTGTLIVQVRGHVFVLKDGVQYDMEYNKPKKRVLGYWLVQS